MGWIRKRLLVTLCALAWLATPWLLWWGAVPAPRLHPPSPSTEAGEVEQLSADGHYLAMMTKHRKPSSRASPFSPEEPLDLCPTLSVWDIDGAFPRFEQTETDASYVVFSPDLSQLLVFGTERGYRLWNTGTSEMRTFLSPAFPAPGIWWAFSERGELLASISWGEISLWNVADLKCIAKFPHRSVFPHPLHFSPDGHELAVENSGPKHQISFFECATHQSRAIPCPLPIGLLFDWTFAPDGKTIAVHLPTTTQAIQLFNATSGAAGQLWRLDGYIRSWAFSPDGKRLAVNVTGIQSELRKLLNRISPRIADAVTPSEDRTILLETETGHTVSMLPYASLLAFRPDGQTLVTYSKDGVLLWDVPPRPRLRLPVRLLPFAVALVLSFVCWRRRRRANGSLAQRQLN